MGDFYGLCARDATIVELILKGYTVPQIAVETGYTAQSVNSYKKKIYELLGVHDKKELYIKIHNEKE